MRQGLIPQRAFFPWNECVVSHIARYHACADGALLACTDWSLSDCGLVPCLWPGDWDLLLYIVHKE